MKRGEIMKDKFDMTLEENLFLAKKGLISNIYNSAKLEGLNVTFPETQTILDGVNVSGVKLDEITCILNLRDAWRETLNSINDSLDLDYICKINGFVSRNESLKWGVLRTGIIGITSTEYIPPIPAEENIKNDLKTILSIPEITLRAIKLMLYGMRSQLFWDGNKRTSMIVANKIMIENGKGIITVKEEFLYEFNKLLTNYYDTNNDKEIIKFIFDNCIFGLELIS